MHVFLKDANPPAVSPGQALVVPAKEQKWWNIELQACSLNTLQCHFVLFCVVRCWQKKRLRCQEVKKQVNSLFDTVWYLHMISGDEMRQILEAVDKLELPAKLRAKEKGEEEDEDETILLSWVNLKVLFWVS